MLKEISFTKYHAAGNDFIVVAATELAPETPTGRVASGKLRVLARAILDRHTGVGADGLFVVHAPSQPRHHAAVRIFNADGSEAEMSGNGIRCAAAWLLESHPAARRLEIETIAGLRSAELVRVHRREMMLRIRMGEPILEPKRIPFRERSASIPLIRHPLRTSRGEIPITVTSLGNPHCSIFVKDFDDFDWRSLGAEIERHSAFPNRTNVEFIRVIGRNSIEVRFWERGVGETASSGTGSSAATVASVLNGLTCRNVIVKTTGGALKIEWLASNQVMLTGPIQRVARGTFDRP